jgi:hypothetical protein
MKKNNTLHEKPSGSPADRPEANRLLQIEPIRFSPTASRFHCHPEPIDPAVKGTSAGELLIRMDSRHQLAKKTDQTWSPSGKGGVWRAVDRPPMPP